MYVFLYRMRILLTIVLVLLVAGGIYYVISTRNYEENLARYQVQVTAAVATAIQSAVYDVTRTVEAPSNVYQLVRLGENEDLEEVADRYGTTLEILRVVNGLAQDVTTGNGETLVIPVGVQVLDPVRTITLYTARAGDTLTSIAEANEISLELLEQDNPMLAQRGVVAGDTVFVGLEL